MEIKSNLKTDRLNSIPLPFANLSPLTVAQKQQALAQLLPRIHVAQTQRVASTQYHVNNSRLHNYIRIVCIQACGTRTTIRCNKTTGGVGPERDRSRLRKVHKNFLFFYLSQPLINDCLVTFTCNV